MQTKLQSTFEAISSVAIGFAITFVAGKWFVYPLFNIHPTDAVNVGVTGCFTATSLIRSYVLRRFFNWFHR